MICKVCGVKSGVNNKLIICKPCRLQSNLIRQDILIKDIIKLENENNNKIVS
jgi:hypothetical protein